MYKKAGYFEDIAGIKDIDKHKKFVKSYRDNINTYKKLDADFDERKKKTPALKQTNIIKRRDYSDKLKTTALGAATGLVGTAAMVNEMGRKITKKPLLVGTAVGAGIGALMGKTKVTKEYKDNPKYDAAAAKRVRAELAKKYNADPSKDIFDAWENKPSKDNYENFGTAGKYVVSGGALRLRNGIDGTKNKGYLTRKDLKSLKDLDTTGTYERALKSKYKYFSALNDG
jgi:hypothetical protein